MVEMKGGYMEITSNINGNLMIIDFTSFRGDRYFDVAVFEMYVTPDGNDDADILVKMNGIGKRELNKIIKRYGFIKQKPKIDRWINKMMKKCH